MEKNQLQASKTFNTLCRALDGNNWHYKKDPEALKIECAAQGDDLPMEITIRVDAERQLVLLMSHLPFVIPKDKRIDLAVAISYVNNKLVDGSFDYDVKSGHIIFRLTNSFRESELGSEAFNYMLLCSFATIDEYNDKLLMLSKGVLPMDKFLEQ